MDHSANLNNNKLDTLQKNLARDLVHLEENESLSEQQLDQITDAYSKVYDIVTKLKSS
jgi:transcriptional regulatory protein LevR